MMTSSSWCRIYLIKWTTDDNRRCKSLHLPLPTTKSLLHPWNRCQSMFLIPRCGIISPLYGMYRSRHFKSIQQTAAAHSLHRLQVLTPLSLLINIAALLVCSLIVSPSVGECILILRAAGVLILVVFRGYHEVTPYIDISFTKDHCRLCSCHIPRPNWLLCAACHG